MVLVRQNGIDVERLFKRGWEVASGNQSICLGSVDNPEIFSFDYTLQRIYVSKKKEAKSPVVDVPIW